MRLGDTRFILLNKYDWLTTPFHTYRVVTRRGDMARTLKNKTDRANPVNIDRSFAPLAIGATNDNYRLSSCIRVLYVF